MARSSRNAAIGLRVKTGRATAVLLRGPAKSPELVERLAIRLTDDAHPDSFQPYHATLGLTRAQEDARIAKTRRVIQKLANAALRDCAKRLRAEGCEVRGVGLVVGSDGDPDRLGNPHVRAHAAEGRLFKAVLEEAAEKLSLPSFVLIEKEAYEKAGLDRTPARLKRELTELGRGRKSWRAEEKTAALAAWAALVR